MKIKNIIECFFILLTSFYSHAQKFEEVLKITATERADEMAFGYSANISGNYIIVGAPNDEKDAYGSNPISDAGAAYIFERSTDGTWNNVKKISASTRGGSHYFGYSVAIDGNFAIVSAPYAEVNESGQIRSEAGYVFIFEKDGYGNWTEVKKLYASDFDMEDHFGYSVDISGNYAIVGALGEDEDALGGNTLSGSGSAYIFERDVAGTWNQIKKLVAPVRLADDQFGCSVAIKNNIAVIGAWLEDEDASESNTLSNSGSAYIYEKNGGTWNFA